MSNALSILAVRAADGGPTTTAPSWPPLSGPAHGLVIALVAVGFCTLVVWVIRRLLFRRKLLLAAPPGRPNRLTPLHVLAPFAVYIAATYIAQTALQGFFQPDSARLTITTDLVARVPLLLAALAVAATSFRYGLRRGLGLSLRHWLFDTGRGVVGFLAVFPICFGLLLLMLWWMPKQADQVHLMLRAVRAFPVGWKLLVVANAVVLAPVTEEVFFRGLVQSMLRRYTRSAWLRVLTASAFFAAVHTIPQDMPALFALGVAMGYNYERCGRLYPAILIHVLFNATNITIALLS